MLSGFPPKPAMFIIASVLNTFLILGHLVIPMCSIYWGMWQADLWSPPGSSSVPGFCSTCSEYKWNSEWMNKSSYPSSSTECSLSISVESPLSCILVQPLNDADVVTTPTALHSYDIKFLNRNWSTGVRAVLKYVGRRSCTRNDSTSARIIATPPPPKVSLVGFWNPTSIPWSLLTLLLFQLSV